MKRFFVFTLTVLFATASLFLTELYALESDYRYATKFNGKVYGEANVWTWFEFPFANSRHHVYVSNDLPGQMKFYGKFTVEVYWNGGAATPQPREESDLVDGDSSGAATHNFSFNLRHKEAGPGYIYATTALDVRNVATNEKLSWPTAACSSGFEL